MANEKALNAYMSHTQDVAEMMAELRAFIVNHGNVDPDDVNWSHTGTMAEVSDQLRSLVNFINNTEE